MDTKKLIAVLCLIWFIIIIPGYIYENNSFVIGICIIGIVLNILTIIIPGANRKVAMNKENIIKTTTEKR